MLASKSLCHATVSMHTRVPPALSRPATLTRMVPKHVVANKHGQPLAWSRFPQETRQSLSSCVATDDIIPVSPKNSDPKELAETAGDLAINKLRHQEDVELQGAHMVLHKLKKVINEVLEVQDVSDALLQQMKAIKHSVDTAAASRHVLGVYGETGSGKTTLLNALLGERVLPSDAARACTSAPTYMRYNTSQSYWVELHFITKEEWHKQVLLILQLAMEAVKDDSSSRPVLLSKHADLKVLHQVYVSVWSQVDWQLEDAAELADCLFGLHPQIHMELAPGAHLTLGQMLKLGAVQMDFKNLKQLQGLLKKQLSAGGKLEPVLSAINISHDWPILARGLVLLDLPGVQDAERARGNVATAGLTNCDSLMVVGPITRFLSNQMVHEFASKLIKRDFEQQTQTNAYRARLFVATKADEVPRTDSELETYCSHPQDFFDDAGVSKQDYTELCGQQPSKASRKSLRARYAHLRQHDVESSAHEQLGLNDLMGSQDYQVFAVSADNYLSLRHAEQGHDTADDCVFETMEQTGLPHLRTLVEMLPDKQLQNLAGAATLSVSQLLMTCRGADSTQESDVYDRASEAFKRRVLILQQTFEDRLREIQTRFLTGPLWQSVEDAREDVIATLGPQLDSMAWNTLKVVCRLSGRLVNRKGGLPDIDLNFELASPIVNGIKRAWVTMFAPPGSTPPGSLAWELQQWRTQMLEAVDSFTEALAGEDRASSTGKVRELCDSRLSSLLAELELMVEREHRGIAHTIKSAVQGHLAATYKENAAEHGTGMAARMKSNVRMALEEEELTIAASEAVEGHVAFIFDRVLEHSKERSAAMGTLADLALGQAATPVLCVEECQQRDQQLQKLIEQTQEIIGP